MSLLGCTGENAAGDGSWQGGGGVATCFREQDTEACETDEALVDVVDGEREKARPLLMDMDRSDSRDLRETDRW